MELHELGREYLAQAEILKKRVKELSGTLGKLSGLEHTAFKRRMASLYSDAIECGRIGRLLLHYYQRGWHGEQDQLQP